MAGAASKQHAMSERAAVLHSLRAQVVVLLTMGVVCFVGRQCFGLQPTTAEGARLIMAMLSLVLWFATLIAHNPVASMQDKLFLKVIVCIGSGTLAFMCGATFLGAPTSRHFMDTINWALWMSMLTVLPGACLLSSDLKDWKQVYILARWHSHEQMLCSLLFHATVLGAWVGAWVIPLDWEQAWQDWPVPCFLGALGGYFAGSVVFVLKLWLTLRKGEGQGSEHLKQH